MRIKYKKLIKVLVVIISIIIFINYINFSNEILNLFSKNVEYLYKPTFTKAFGNHEIALVYIGSSRCYFCNSKEFYKQIDYSKYLYSELARDLKINFTSIGVSIDWKIENGMSHLNKMGDFNELIIGNNWFNEAVFKYVGNYSFEASTPQLLIILREYETLNDQIWLGTDLHNEELIAIYRGSEQINEVSKLNIDQLKDYISKKIQNDSQYN